VSKQEETSKKHFENEKEKILFLEKVSNSRYRVEESQTKK